MVTHILCNFHQLCDMVQMLKNMKKNHKLYFYIPCLKPPLHIHQLNVNSLNVQRVNPTLQSHYYIIHILITLL